MSLRKSFLRFLLADILLLFLLFFYFFLFLFHSLSLYCRLSAPTPLTIGDQVYTLPPPGEGGPPGEGEDASSAPIAPESVQTSTSEVQILNATSEEPPPAQAVAGSGNENGNTRGGGGRGLSWLWGGNKQKDQPEMPKPFASSPLEPSLNHYDLFPVICRHVMLNRSASTEEEEEEATA